MADEIIRFHNNEKDQDNYDRDVVVLLDGSDESKDLIKELLIMYDKYVNGKGLPKVEQPVTTIKVITTESTERYSSEYDISNIDLSYLNLESYPASLLRILAKAERM